MTRRAGRSRPRRGALRRRGTTGQRAFAGHLESAAERPGGPGSGRRTGIRAEAVACARTVGSAARLPLRGDRLARREPVAGLLVALRFRFGALGHRLVGRFLGGGLGRRGLRRRVLVDRCADDDGRDGPRAGDVDPDAGGQGRLGLRLVGRLLGGLGHGGRAGLRSARGTLPLLRVQGRERARAVGRGPRGVRGTAASLGTGGRTVSFTSQSRLSRLATPPVTSLGGRLAGAPTIPTCAEWRLRSGGTLGHTQPRGRPWPPSHDLFAPDGTSWGSVAQITAAMAPPSR